MKKTKATLAVENDILTVSGSIHFDTVMALYQEGQKLFSVMPKIMIDLHELHHCDSSGLALCTAWMREADMQKKSVHFMNVPLFMQDLIRVYGLDFVLPIKMVV